MAVFTTCSNFFANFAPGDEPFDYGLFIPGDAYRPLPADEWIDEETGGEMSEDERRRSKQRREEERKAEEEAAMQALMQKDELKDKFEEKAGGGGGTLDATQCAHMAREMGLAPSEEDVKKLQEEKKNNVTFDDFKEFLKSCTHPEDNPDHLLEFFRHYDPANSGKLSKKQIKNILQNFGDPLTDQEVDGLFRVCAINSDPVDYALMVERLLAKKEQL